MKIYQTCFIIALFCLVKLIHVMIYLLIVYGLLRYFKCHYRNSHDGSLPNLTGPLPIFHHRPSYMQKAMPKLILIKNPHDCIHMPCVNIHRSGRWKWFLHVHTYLQLLTHCMDLTAFSCLCSKIKRYTQLILC